jgi:Tol biopolymer transport system component
VVNAKGTDIFVYDWERDAMTRLTFDGHSSYPVWTPDGKHIAFFSKSGGSAVWWVRSDGAGEQQRLFQSPNSVHPSSFSPDGKRLLYDVSYTDPGDDLWSIALGMSDPERPKAGTPEQFLHEPFDNQFPLFSPDGRWVAYRSFETGTWQIYVRPFPGPGGKWQISTEGATQAWWSHNGRDLFFREVDGRIMVVTYAVNGNSFIADRPRLWSDKQLNLREQTLDLAPDGKRFAGLPARDDPEVLKGPVHLTFLLNFFDELARRVPRAGK